MSIRQTTIGTSFVAALLLAGATAFAQIQTMPGQPNSAPTNVDPSAPTFSAADQSFVEDTLKGNETQVELSQLAQQKASSLDVKTFSQQMVQIHTQLNQQLAPLAKQLQVDTNQKPSKPQKKVIAQLAQLSGSDFDTAYLQAMGNEQARSLKQFRKEETAQNAYIQKIAKTDEPVLSQHYQTLQTLAQTHNVTIANVE
jgi:putative membrane protein